MSAVVVIDSARGRAAACVLVLCAAAALGACRGPSEREHSDDPPLVSAGRGEAGSRAGAGARAGGADDADSGAAGRDATANDRDAAAGMCPDAPPSETSEPPPEPDTVHTSVSVEPHRHFAIHLVDAATGAALAGARLTTTNYVTLVSDRNGAIAFYEPGLMDGDVWFTPTHPGYQIESDGFGFAGKTLTVREGGSVELAMERVADAPAPQVSSDLQTRLLEADVPGPDACFAVHAVDASTGRGVPLVRLSAAGEDFWSDSQGLIALCDPDRMGERIDFDVFSHGYRLAGGGSVTLAVSAGGSAQIELERLDIAERLYRVTGQGIYRDSVLLGRATPTTRPVLNGRVMGQDSVQSALYDGGIFWLWGDTAAPHHPLGNYHTSGARSQLPAAGGLGPEAGVDQAYFVGANGFARGMAPPSTVPGDGVTWLSALTAVPDANGPQRLLANYGKFRDLTTQTERGIVEFDDASELFVKALQFPSVDTLAPDQHALHWRHAEGEYVYYPPSLRVPARAEALLDPDSYESFTPRMQGGDGLERAADGRLSYAWRPATKPANAEQLAAAGVARDQALDGHLSEPDSGEAVAVHSSSALAWNAHRGRFVEIVLQLGGSSSFLGEIWYAEGDTPLGPFVYARKIVTHDNYTFYNPRQHPFFDQAGGRIVFFEGSYTTTFSDDALPTPRYEYNQIMYRLDLDDPRLALPVPVYDVGTDAVPELATKSDLTSAAAPLRAAFFARDRAGDEVVPLAWSGPSCAAGRRLVPDAVTTPVFYALPAGPDAAPAGALPLYEYEASDGRHAYRAGDAPAPAGFTRSAEPIAYVWPSPIDVALPVAEYLGDLVANAGPDQCLVAPANGGPATVMLDASASAGAPAEVTAYIWHLPPAAACPVALGAQTTVALPAGVHTVRLEVRDAQGRSDVDTMIIEVTAGP